MAKLTEQQKAFIVHRLACYDTPSVVVQAVKDEFNIELPRQHVQQYDPTKFAGRQLGKKLRALFEETRQRFINDTSEIAVSHKSVRLARLERMADKAEAKGNYPLAAQLLEQIAKEMGDQFTNLRKVAPTDPAGEQPWRAASDDELDKRIQELDRKLNGQG